MIEGLHFDIEFDEMKEHLRAKARHHDDRRLFYEKQVKALGGKLAGELSDGERPPHYTGTSGDPMDVLRNKAISHEGRSSFFQFMADHLVEGETYRLSEGDLMTLEFISRRY